MSGSLRLYLMLGLDVVLLGGFFYYGHLHYIQGKDFQKKTDSALIATLRTQITEEKAALNKINAATAQAQKQAQQQKVLAQQVLLTLKKTTDAQALQAAHWQAQLRAAEQSAPCAKILHQQICAAIGSY